MVVRDGLVSGARLSDVADLLRDMLQQQTAMLQVQAESVHLQRLLVERLLGASNQSATADEAAPDGAPASPASTLVPRAQASAPPCTPPAPLGAERSAAPTDTTRTETETETQTASDLPFAPASVDQNAARGARYYKPRAAAAVRSVAPEELELMRRLQEMRDASDLILQFGPYKGSTLAQVAMSDPEYIRQLMTGAQRPEVRAAAGRLVQALDAAAEHRRKTTRGSLRRGRPT